CPCAVDTSVSSCAFGARGTTGAGTAMSPRTWVALWAVCLAFSAGVAWTRGAQPEAARAVLGPPTELPAAIPSAPVVFPTLPISLPAALRLAGVRPLDIQLAQQRLEVAAAQLARAELLWLPSIYLGADYFRHDGQIQDVAGNVFGTS